MILALILLYAVAALGIYAARRRKSAHPLLDALLWPITLAVFILAAVLRLLITTGGSN